MTIPEDITEIELAGRLCAVCHTGRRWRPVEVVRAEGHGPVVMCAACRARYGGAPPVAATEQDVAAPVSQPEATAPKQPEAAAPKRPSAPREDRLRRALRE